MTAYVYTRIKHPGMKATREDEQHRPGAGERESDQDVHVVVLVSERAGELGEG